MYLYNLEMHVNMIGCIYGVVGVEEVERVKRVGVRGGVEGVPLRRCVLVSWSGMDWFTLDRNFREHCFCYDSMQNLWWILFNMHFRTLVQVLSYVFVK